MRDLDQAKIKETSVSVIKHWVAKLSEIIEKGDDIVGKPKKVEYENSRDNETTLVVNMNIVVLIDCINEVLPAVFSGKARAWIQIQEKDGFIKSLKQKVEVLKTLLPD